MIFCWSLLWNLHVYWSTENGLTKRLIQTPILTLYSLLKYCVHEAIKQRHANVLLDNYLIHPYDTYIWSVRKFTGKYTGKFCRNVKKQCVKTTKMCNDKNVAVLFYLSGSSLVLLTSKYRGDILQRRQYKNNHTSVLYMKPKASN